MVKHLVERRQRHDELLEALSRVLVLHPVAPARLPQTVERAPLIHVQLRWIDGCENRGEVVDARRALVALR